MVIDVTQINPMDWFNTKFIVYIPEHFVRVRFRHQSDRAEVLDWLEKNTSGRYAIEETVSEGFPIFTQDKDIQIGFENPADATMYTMFFR